MCVERSTRQFGFRHFASWWHLGEDFVASPNVLVVLLNDASNDVEEIVELSLSSQVVTNEVVEIVQLLNVASNEVVEIVE